MALDPFVHMEKTLKGAAARLRYDEKGDFPAWQEEARGKLRGLLGLDLMKPCPDDFRTEWVREEEGFTEHRVLFASEEDVDVLCHVLIPRDGREDRLPAVICLQGHSKGMHISLGRPKYPGDEQTISGGDRDFARQVIARGQIAIVMEQRGFGERGGTPEGPACHQYAVQAMLVGQTLIGQRVFDISRAIDILPGHFPRIDSSRIAVMGNSGGGTASVYAAACDTRIAAAMPSCAFCGFTQSIGLLRHCICNYVPGIMNWFDMGDLACLIAPRPLVIVNGKDDKIFPLESAMQQYAIAEKGYRTCGAAEKLRHVTGPAGHRFYAELGWAAFDEVTGWK